ASAGGTGAQSAPQFRGGASPVGHAADPAGAAREQDQRDRATAWGFFRRRGAGPGSARITRRGGGDRSTSRGPDPLGNRTMAAASADRGRDRGEAGGGPHCDGGAREGRHGHA